MSGPPAASVRPAVGSEPSRLGPLFVRAGFGAHLAEVATFARDRLGGQVFVAELAGEAVGASACAWFGASGWVGGVVVAPERRGAGLGGTLTQAAVDQLRSRGAATVLLYATPMGLPVYLRLGFVPEGEVVTMTGPGREVPGDGSVPPEDRPAAGEAAVRAARAEDLAAVLPLDRLASGEDRERLLRALWPAGALVAGTNGALRGFHLPSPWHSGGTTVAVDPAAGEALLRAALPAGGARLRVNLPAGNLAGARALAAAGFQEEWRTTRMRLGPPVPWRQDVQFGAHSLFWG
ncbi:MAG TPA: GNAT family N-acetyltransferase [Actinomycetes bacterium]|jgi:GNAT superfamily N-acetyltransferase|nr:GNAT family N-acetyltransferase [Actinomycetes bacterium]